MTIAEQSLALHAEKRGKIEVVSTVPHRLYQGTGGA